MPDDRFIFRRHDTIGAEAAEEDGNFLASCFTDIGDLETLIDCDNPKRIILGRTGVGKTALIDQLAAVKEVIRISPESLSFNYLTNSGTIQFFSEAGVKLDLFFKLLWRHVFAVELLKRKYKINDESSKKSFLAKIEGIITRDKKKERAINYLRQWGDKFWEPTEYRIKEITGKIESELKGSLGIKLNPVELGGSGASKLTEEMKQEVVQRGQAVINEIQMRELTDVLEFLNDDIFVDPKQRFYICIDKLDENWVDEKFRYLLIRNLIETIREFQRVRNIKIIIVLRTDLVDRVVRYTRDSGFQEEKYRSLFLSLKWSRAQLGELLDKRVSYMVRQRYTKKPVGHSDILPRGIDGVETLQYMVDRTLMRPRELIEFFNECIELAEGKPEITKTILLDAEEHYSKKRLRSLQDEWVADYPSLADFAFILRKHPKHFKINELNFDQIEEFILNYAIEFFDRTDSLSLNARNVAEGITALSHFLPTLFHVFYRTGLVGLKTETYESFQWVSIGNAIINGNHINGETGVRIHPMFYRVLGIRP